MLVGYWKMDKWIENDVEITSQLQFQHKFGFAKDGTYYYSYYDAGFKLVINFTGTWEFRRRKEQLVLGLMDPRFGMKYEVWDIIKFTRKALWLECVSPEKLVKWQLIPQ